MEIIFLGTSSGTPTKSRNVSGTVVKKANSKHWYLVDCGEGTQHQLLRAKLSLRKLKAVLITHVHGDHCYGLPGLIASATMSGRTAPLLIIAPQEIRQWIEMTCDISQMRLTYELQFMDVALIEQPLSLQSFDIEITELSHRVPSYAFSFSENQIQRPLDTEKLKRDGIEPSPVWGQIQKQQDVILESGKTLHADDYLLPAHEPRKVIISGDNDQPGLLHEAAKSADLLVHEATFTQEVSDKVGPHPQHSSAKMVGEFAESVQLKHLILTHFSVRYQDAGTGISVGTVNEIEQEAKQYYTGNLNLAEDLVTYTLSQDGDLQKQERL